MTRPVFGARLLALAASRRALESAADQLADPGSSSELAGAASLVDRQTVERVVGWLRRRASLYADAGADLGESATPLLTAADARVLDVLGRAESGAGAGELGG